VVLAFALEESTHASQKAYIADETMVHTIPTVATVSFCEHKPAIEAPIEARAAAKHIKNFLLLNFSIMLTLL
jgi:hypothetical protein